MTRIAVLLASTATLVSALGLSAAPGAGAASRPLVLLHEGKVLANGSRIVAFLQLEALGGRCAHDNHEGILKANAVPTTSIAFKNTGDEVDICDAGSTAEGFTGALGSVTLSGAGKVVAKAKPAFKLKAAGCTYQVSKIEATFIPPIQLSEAPGLFGKTPGKSVPPSAPSCAKGINLEYEIRLRGEQTSQNELLVAEAP